MRFLRAAFVIAFSLLLAAGQIGQRAVVDKRLDADNRVVAPIIAVVLLPVVQGTGGRPERAGPVNRGGAAYASPLQDGDGFVFGLSTSAFLVQRGVGFGLFLIEIGAALSGPSSTMTTFKPARVSSSAVMPAPAPEPMMATSQVIFSGSAPWAPPNTFQPRFNPSRIGSCKLLMK